MDESENTTSFWVEILMNHKKSPGLAGAFLMVQLSTLLFYLTNSTLSMWVEQEMHGS